MEKLFGIARLIAKEKTGELSENEKNILKNWLESSENNNTIYRKLQKNNQILQDMQEMKQYNVDKAFRKIEKSVSLAEKKVPFIPVYIKYAAAICLLMASAWFLTQYFYQPVVEISESTFVSGNQKAILVTADNKKIVLDSAVGQQIIKDRFMTIVNSGSTLNYQQSNTFGLKEEKPVFNTLMIPRGGEYHMILSDGTEVWMNSESELKYPVRFHGDKRLVELKGEAFFKVAKSETMPFIVSTSELNVKVYGTEFNVSAYPAENIVHTTLVEGSVSVNLHTSEELKISPNEQCTYNKITAGYQIQKVDVQRYLAWKNGFFMFENEAIGEILKQMSRWYDFDVEFQDLSLSQQRFTLSLSKKEQIAYILDLIEASSNLRFQAKGKTIIVDSE